MAKRGKKIEMKNNDNIPSHHPEFHLSSPFITTYNTSHVIIPSFIDPSFIEIKEDICLNNEQKEQEDVVGIVVVIVFIIIII